MRRSFLHGLFTFAIIGAAAASPPSAAVLKKLSAWEPNVATLPAQFLAVCPDGLSESGFRAAVTRLGGAFRSQGSLNSGYVAMALVESGGLYRSMWSYESPNKCCLTVRNVDVRTLLTAFKAPANWTHSKQIDGKNKSIMFMKPRYYNQIDTVDFSAEEDVVIQTNVCRATRSDALSFYSALPESQYDPSL